MGHKGSSERINIVTDFTKESAATLAKMIRQREASPVEILEAHLKRIESVNPSLNAIVTLNPDALAQARQAEAAVMRGTATGLLSGVPITVKDTIETRGLRSTSGSPTRANFVPEDDSPAVAKLRDAGAIIIGKTNTAEMAMDYTADNPVFGRTNNPHDLSRTPGGSSGGEGAAIASGMSPAGIGSDLAGSIRIPAHFCGIAGLKPGTGRVPKGGQSPSSVGPYALASTIGPMARRVEDLQLLFEAMTGVTVDSQSLKGWRVAWYADDNVSRVTDETRLAVQNAGEALGDAGLIVEERVPPGCERGYELWLKLFSRASVVQLRAAYDGRESEGGSFVRWRLATADDRPPATLDEYIRDWMLRDHLRAQLIRWMDNVPLIVAPVGAVPAVVHDTLKVTVKGETFGLFKAFSYAQTFNVFDLPAVTVPAGRSNEGLPIGVQIIGRPQCEQDVLAAATIVERALGGWQPPRFPTSEK
jgi:Asp-tRNA(Asn)/Glu-tRNA(Gln) amidotransferase A subunit family amidase